MKLNADLIDELTLLSQFKLSSTFEGIKVHTQASQNLIDAAQRLFDKGLISQNDGGYLTDLGKDAADHFERLQSILTTPAKLDTTS
ncbi:MAG: TIGR02647 family protein [Pseudomonadales bacterium]|nr:TIGR02647 family protein [Pseudomonadales bacterium]NRA14148.1 TIGR02647 family protein [Oceanospirillaceae bacterium]